MSSKNTPLAEFIGVSKAYGKKRAVNAFSFEVCRGEIVGLLGPNGAGKSTSMKMLTGYVQATGGDIRVLGHDIRHDTESAQEQMGYLPESTPLYAEWTVEEFLKFSAYSRNLRGVRKSVDKAVGRSGLEGVTKQLIGTLSKGYRQRTCFAQSILHDPPLLVLDEATDGLDPNQKKAMQEFIKDMGRDKGILFSTHILSEAEAICDRVLVLNEGELVHDGDVASLKERSTVRKQIRLTLSGAVPEALQQCLEQIREIRTFTIDSDQAEGITALITEETKASDEGGPPLSLLLADQAVKHHWPIIELRQETSSLSDAFAFITHN